MLAILLCLCAFVLVWWFTRRSLVAGILAALTVGYFYGIIRANVPQAFSHFIFDAALGGLYLGTCLRGLTPIQRIRTQKVRKWVLLLIGWPLVLFFIPRQEFLIQLVGLRGVIWFIPFLLYGALIDDGERTEIAAGIAVLNLVALAFGLAEYSIGLESFYPHNNVTQLIYIQHDVLQDVATVFRIPSTFVQQAAYGATMVMTVPLLVGAWVQPESNKSRKMLLAGGIVAATLGVFLAASRTQAMVLFAQLAALVTFAKIRLQHLIALAAIGAALGYIIYTHPRLQRFTQLDSGYVEQRIQGSVNEGFSDALIDYPLGNGLGGGGTSTPYFLRDRVKNPVGIENEYARILLETGIPGLVLWVAFIAMAVGTAPRDRAGPWRIGFRLARVATALSFITGVLGTGLLTAIPNSSLLLMMAGWLCAPKLKEMRVTVDEDELWAYGAAR